MDLKRRIFRLLPGLALLGLVGWSAPAWAANIDLGTAGAYNLFILSNLTISNNQEPGGWRWAATPS